MNQKVKIGIAAGAFLAAFIVMAYSFGWGRSATGAGVEATATCPKCGYSENVRMSEVFSKGHLDTGRGWQLPCPKCQTNMPVKRSGVEEGKVTTSVGQ